VDTVVDRENTVEIRVLRSIRCSMHRCSYNIIIRCSIAARECVYARRLTASCTLRYITATVLLIRGNRGQGVSLTDYVLSVSGNWGRISYVLRPYVLRSYKK